MIETTIASIEAKIRNSQTINPERRRELLELVDRLKAEMGSLGETHDERAQSIAGFAQVSTYEATRTTQDPELLNLSLKGLSSSVQGFETSHPKLVQVVNSISHTLSNLGI